LVRFVGPLPALSGGMRPINVLLLLCGLFCLNISPAQAASTHRVKGVVITPDGTVVPEFSIVVKHVSDKPQLVRRLHFKNGEFTIDLDAARYDLVISAPLYINNKVVLDFTSRSQATDYCIVVIHAYRTETRLAPGGAYSVSVKTLQEKVPEAARDAYLKAVELHRQGQLEPALIEYGRALRSYPQYLEALTDIGTIFLLYNRPEAAMTFLRRARDVDESNPIINFNIAVALTEQGQYNEALKLLKDVLHREPQMAMAEYLIGKIHYIQKKYDLAEKSIQQAVEKDPFLLDAWVLMINIGLERKDYDQAREALQRVRETINNRMVTKFIDEQLSTLGS